MKIINAITFGMILFLCAFALWKKQPISLLAEIEKNKYLLSEDRKRGKQYGKKMLWFIVGYLFLVIRTIGIVNIPGGVNQDGAMAAVEANSLANYLTDRFGTWLPAHLEGWGFAQMNATMSYLMVPFVKILGLNKLSMRLPTLILSCIGAAAVVMLVKKITDEKAAFIAALFIAINPWHFMQSRWALESNFFPHFFVIGLCFFVYGLSKYKYLYISMIFFGLSMYCYGVSFFMVPFFLIANAAYLIISKKVNVKQLLYCIGIYFGISWPIYLTMLVNYMKWNTISLPFVTIQYFEGTVRAQDILFFSEDIAKQLSDNLRSLINIVFLQKDDLLWNNIPGFGSLYLCTLPLVIVGIILLIVEFGSTKDSQRKIVSFTILSYWFFSILLGAFINNVNINRINIVFYANIILAVIGIYFIVTRWRKTAGIVICVYTLQSLLFFNTYFSTWANEIDDVFYCDFIEALDEAKSYNADYYVITPDTQYEGAWPVSEILVLFEFDVDSAFYWGATDNWNGKEIPYNERFRYIRMKEDTEPSNQVVYVLQCNNISKFLSDKYLIKTYGEYATVIPWEIVWESWEE